MLTLLWLYLGIGVVGVFLALPLIAEKVKPNPIYGFRVRQTLEDPKVWYAVNKHFGWRFLIVSLITILASVGLFFISPNEDIYALSMAGIFLLSFGLGFSQTWRYLKTLK